MIVAQEREQLRQQAAEKAKLARKTAAAKKAQPAAKGGNGGKASGKGGNAGGKGGKGGLLPEGDSSDSGDEEGDLGSGGEDDDGNQWIRIDALTKAQARERFSSKGKVKQKRRNEHKKTHYDAIWAACRAFGCSGPFAVRTLTKNRAFLIKMLKLDGRHPHPFAAKKRGASADERDDDSEEDEHDDGDERKPKGDGKPPPPPPSPMPVNDWVDTTTTTTRKRAYQYHPSTGEVRWPAKNVPPPPVGAIAPASSGAPSGAPSGPGVETDPLVNALRGHNGQVHVYAHGAFSGATIHFRSDMMDATMSQQPGPLQLRTPQQPPGASLTVTQPGPMQHQHPAPTHQHQQHHQSVPTHHQPLPTHQHQQPPPPGYLPHAGQPGSGGAYY